MQSSRQLKVVVPEGRGDRVVNLARGDIVYVFGEWVVCPTSSGPVVARAPRDLDPANFFILSFTPEVDASAFALLVVPSSASLPLGWFDWVAGVRDDAKWSIDGLVTSGPPTAAAIKRMRGIDPLTAEVQAYIRFWTQFERDPKRAVVLDADVYSYAILGELIAAADMAGAKLQTRADQFRGLKAAMASASCAAVLLRLQRGWDVPDRCRLGQSLVDALVMLAPAVAARTMDEADARDPIFQLRRVECASIKSGSAVVFHGRVLRGTGGGIAAPASRRLEGGCALVSDGDDVVVR